MDWTGQTITFNQIIKSVKHETSFCRPNRSLMFTSSMLWGGGCESVEEYYNKCVGVPFQLLPTVLGLKLAVDIELGSRWELWFKNFPRFQFRKLFRDLSFKLNTHYQNFWYPTFHVRKINNETWNKLSTGGYILPWQSTTFLLRDHRGEYPLKFGQWKGKSR